MNDDPAETDRTDDACYHVPPEGRVHTERDEAILDMTDLVVRLAAEGYRISYPALTRVVAAGRLPGERRPAGWLFREGDVPEIVRRLRSGGHRRRGRQPRKAA